jgi:hydroxyacylglutathione hydrolase
MSKFNVTAIPAFTDNYIWLIRGEGTQCAVVDPGDAAPVLETLQRQGLDLRYILLTHHHPDHIGGMMELKKLSSAVVFGPRDHRIKGVDHALGEGDTAVLEELGLEFAVLEVPGHTSTHIVFWGHDCLFCGDTLFSVGCGRLFEGTAQQMQSSLDKLAALPPSTRVYCGHEYTRANCEFALAVEPDNQALQQKSKAVERLRSRGECTLPGLLEEELAVNPFLRSRAEGVVQAARNRDPGTTAGAGTLAVIRSWKDHW